MHKAPTYIGPNNRRKKRTEFGTELVGDINKGVSGHRLNYEHVAGVHLPWATLTVEWTDKHGHYEWNHEECAQTMLATYPEYYNDYMEGRYPNQEFDELDIWKRIQSGEDVLALTG